ncbi:MAG: translocation/assembly module TamB domain-containing protein [Terracidiphilus sp.]
MSTHELKLPNKSTRKRRRRVLLGAAACVLLGVVAVVGLCFWGSSASFENLVREKLIARLESSVGGRVEIRSFHWRLLKLEVDAGGIVIHGREAANEAPYAQIAELRVQLSVLGFLSPHIVLRELEVTRPEVHLIVYPDGSTNQPAPRRVAQPGKPLRDTLFDLRAGQVTVEHGLVDFENRAASFDFQNRQAPLDLSAREGALRVAYVPAQGKIPESYRIVAGARDVRLMRGATAHPLTTPVQGTVTATLDLTRTAAHLRSLRVTGRSKDAGERTLNLTGELHDFARPSWQGEAQGELDLRLLESLTGYPNAPEGIARLQLGASGYDGQFRVDGPVHIDGGTYIQPGVTARGVTLDAIVHADPNQLIVRSVVARIAAGGQLKGEVALDHWLPPIPGGTSLEVATAPPVTHFWRRRRVQPVKPAPAPPANQPLPLVINGKVTANLEAVSIDTVMDIVGRGPFERMGLHGQLDGPAIATWTNGDANTLVVSATLRVSPSGQAQPGEAAASGIIDAIYTQRNGGVELRALHLALPASVLDAHGHLGAYPLTSPTAIDVNFQSRNLNDFDRVLRDLGLRREGKAGSAALPISLGGQAAFSGTWTGSLVDPHLAGNLTANNLVVELPANPQDGTGKTHFVRLDSLQATGGYTANRITVDHSELHHDAARLSVAGSLTAAPQEHEAAGVPAFDRNSVLRAHLDASEVRVDEFQPLLGLHLPVTGQLSAQLQTDGPVHALGGSGWIELNQATAWGQPVMKLRAQGKLAEGMLQLSAVSLNDPSGKVSGNGSYDLKTKRFQLEAQGSGIDLAQLRQLQQSGLGTKGKFSFNATASGTIDDPQLTAKGTLTDLILSGEQVGNVDLTARTANHKLLYDLDTHFVSATLTAHGETALQEPYETQMQAQMSQFNIGALLKMAHVQGLSGESSLAGTVHLEGPLRRPEEMRGEALLQTLSLTVVGVHLRSEGSVHATLANEKIVLDPVHVTGEETDLRAHGTIDLKARRQLDLEASGSINLRLAETIDPDVTASGVTTFQVRARGTLDNPGLSGQIEFQDASLALQDLPNSLSQLRGTLVFNQNRLEVQSLTARTGGGALSVSGYLAYQQGIFAALNITGQGVRIRYPEGVSSLADANLQLQGTQNNLLLSGRVLVTRFSVSPDLDVASLVTRTSKVQPVASPDAPSSHVRLDVRIQSSPQLSFQNAFAKLAGDVDLRLSGTLGTPSLLGRISITEGNATLAGTRYDLQRGDISFTNPVRIEPILDMSATARVEDYDITLGMHGPPNKLSVTYRSDPPLSDSDVVALLALGRTENQERLYTQQQEQVANSPVTDALLGGALNATMSNRVQKLFGVGSVKVDPSYLGLLGNSTTRITVEEQLGRNIKLTWATDVDTTAQQLLQAEIAINRHVSLQITRDESYVFSMVIKATRRYR